MIRKEEVFKIGVLGKPHGVNGEISMIFTDDVFDRTDADYVVLSIDGIMVPFFIEEYRFKGSETALMKFCDIDNAEKAHELTGIEIFFPKSLSDGQENNTLSWNDILGFTIINNDSKRIVGTVNDIDDTTTNVLFNIQTPDNQEILIPASDELITEINQKNKTIMIIIPEGLLDI